MNSLSLRNLSLDNGWVAIAVEGDVDLATVDELQSAIDSVFDGGQESLVVDLNDSSFMDSTGLKALVMTHRRFEEAERAFAIAVSAGPVSRLIDLSGVRTTIRCVDTVEELSASD